MWIPKGAARIRGWPLFEVRHLLEEIRYLILISIVIILLQFIHCSFHCNFIHNLFIFYYSLIKFYCSNPKKVTQSRFKKAPESRFKKVRKCFTLQVQKMSTLKVQKSSTLKLQKSSWIKVQKSSKKFRTQGLKKFHAQSSK